MYASQTKRLCVRGTSPDENRGVQHHQSSTTPASPAATAATITTQREPANNQRLSRSSSSSNTSQHQNTVSETTTASNPDSPCETNNMTAAATATTASNACQTVDELADKTASTSAQSSSSSTIVPISPAKMAPPASAGSPTSTNPSETQATNLYSFKVDSQLQQTQTQHQQPSSQSNHFTASSCEEIALQDLIDRLASLNQFGAEDEKHKVDLLLSLRNLITACNKKKDLVVSSPNFSRIINLIDNDNISPVVKSQVALLLCSIAKSGERTIKCLNELSVDDKILNLILSSNDDSLIEACLRCMRSLMSWPKASRTWLLYDNIPLSATNEEATMCSDQMDTSSDTFSSGNQLSSIIAFVQNSKSFIVQECIADTFAATCLRSKDQIMLLNASALPCITQLLESSSERVVISSLNWLTQMCFKNQVVCAEIRATQCPSGTLLLDRLIQLMSKDNWHELQFLASRCFANVYRASSSPASSTESSDEIETDSRIVSHVLPTLIRMVRRNEPPYLRTKAAECIAYLIESETRLQNIASVCDHLIDSLADMLDYEQSSVISSDCNSHSHTRDSTRQQDRGVSWLSISAQQIQQQQQSIPPPLDLRPVVFQQQQQQQHQQQQQAAKQNQRDSTTAVSTVCVDKSTCETSNEMKRAAFLALASLASNLEPIRKKIFNTCSIMQHLVKSVTDSDIKTLKSVLTCLLSLSRSVQQLRTSFAENSIYSALKGLLSTTSNDVLILVLAILCNISLDFSPGKQHFLDTKTIEILCNLTRRSDPVLRLHGIWILMNMVYQLKDQNLKFQILRSLGISHLLGLLETKNDDEIVLKTLGFIRNLLSQKSHIEEIMATHGEQIMKALIKMLERPCSSRIKEQSLCVLTNIADGTESKSFIMTSRYILNFLARIICDEQAGDIRLAAICCITNLIHKGSEGSYERRSEMKKYGIEEKLKSMLNTSDPVLSDRVRTAYNQFLINDEDICELVSTFGQ